MRTITINKRKVDFINNKLELSLKTYQLIVSTVDFDKIEEDWIKLFNILTSSSFRIEDLEMQIKLLNAMSWCINGVSFDDFTPLELNIRGKVIEVPTSHELVIGQAIALKQCISKFKYVDEGISIAVAIYLQPLVDGKKFSLARAKELEKELLEMPAYLFHTIGNFILGQLQTSGLVSLTPRNLTHLNLTKVLKTLQRIWLIVVVLPGTGICHLLYVTLNFFRLMLISFLKIVPLIRYVRFFPMKRSSMSLKRDIQSFIIN